jgi:hypothetical protein
MVVMFSSHLDGKLITPGLWAPAHVGKFTQIFINSNRKIGTQKTEGTVNSYSVLGNMTKSHSSSEQ